MDDSYITFRYADHLAHGKGFVFNEGERVQGTTTPLFTLLIACSLLVFSDPQKIGLVLSILFFCGAGLLAFKIFAERGSPWAGASTLVLILSSPQILKSLTMETGLYVFLLFSFFWLKQNRHHALASLAASLAFLTRFDGILLFPFALLDLEGERRQGRLGLPIVSGRWAIIFLVGPALAWLIFAQLYFGSVLPNTFFAKAHMDSSFQMDNQFIRGFLFWARNGVSHKSGVIFAAFIVFCVAGLAGEMFRKGSRAWIAGWAVLYFLGYCVVNPPWRFHWYITVLICGIFAVQANLPRLYQRFREGKMRAAMRLFGYAWYAFVACVVVLNVQAEAKSPFFRPMPGYHLSKYKAMGEYVAKNAAPEATIAAAEIGVLGYYCKRRVIDIVGLVSPDSNRWIRRYGWRRGIAALVAEKEPDYLVMIVEVDWPERPQARQELFAKYQPVMHAQRGAHQVILFKRTDGPVS